MTGNTANNDSPFTNEDLARLSATDSRRQKAKSLTLKLMMFPLCCSKKEGERRKGRAKGREERFILTDLK